MFIVNQDRDAIINADNVVRIFVENEVRIVAETVGNYNNILGIYVKREKKAQEVFEEILNTVFIPNLIAINTVVPEDYAEKFKELQNEPWGIAIGEGSDIKPFARAVYYMPEQ